MQLTELEFDDTVDLTILDYNGEPTDIVFVLAGPGHPARVDLDRKVTARTLRDFNKRGKPSLPTDPDEIREDETERMVALTLDWRGVTDANDATVPFTKEAVRKAYENRKSSVRSQVQRGLLDISNFTRSSSGS